VARVDGSDPIAELEKLANEAAPEEKNKDDDADGSDTADK
jgi:hypothetical protein